MKRRKKSGEKVERKQQMPYESERREKISREEYIEH